MALAATLLADCALPPSKLSSGILPDPEAIRAATDPSMRLGAAGLDTATGRTVLIDGDARYAMCSTFKVPLAAAILSAVDRGELDLEEKVRFGEPDVLDYAPVIKEHLETGMLSVRALCAAAVELSDNSAANLLLPLVGGPAGLTRFMRDCGDPISRLDRLEPDLNTNLPGDLRDTTTPTTMVGLLHSLLMGDILSERSRQQLIE